jgi:hypothetical protein
LAELKSARERLGEPTNEDRKVESEAGALCMAQLKASLSGIKATLGKLLPDQAVSLYSQIEYAAYSAYNLGELVAFHDAGMMRTDEQKGAGGKRKRPLRSMQADIKKLIDSFKVGGHRPKPKQVYAMLPDYPGLENGSVYQAIKRQIKKSFEG